MHLSSSPSAGASSALSHCGGDHARRQSNRISRLEGMLIAICTHHLSSNCHKEETNRKSSRRQVNCFFYCKKIVNIASFGIKKTSSTSIKASFARCRQKAKQAVNREVRIKMKKFLKFYAGQKQTNLGHSA